MGDDAEEMNSLKFMGGMVPERLLMENTMLNSVFKRDNKEHIIEGTIFHT
jgi:hypothetical protein